MCKALQLEAAALDLKNELPGLASVINAEAIMQMHTNIRDPAKVPNAKVQDKL